MTTKIIQTFYISTGRKNAMFTLRCSRDTINGALAKVDANPDFYICNLAATEDKAIEKAREHVEAFRQRVGENNSFSIFFDDCIDITNIKRRGKLSAADTIKIEDIENGVVPFGKHKGEQIEDMTQGYILFFADKIHDENTPVFAAFCAICLGIALENGYIAKREEKRAEQFDIDSKSNFIGEVGQRLDFEGELFYCYHKVDNYVDCWINKVRCGDNIVTYIGNKVLGEKGSVVNFKGTIKEHQVYKGIKSTKINRPCL